MSAIAGMDEFEYSDDDLDALNGDDFLALEDRAIRLTQAPLTAAPQHNLKLCGPPDPDTGTRRQYIWEGQSDSNSFGYSELNQETLGGNLIEPPARPFLGEAKGPNVHESPGESTQREQWRQERFGHPPQQQSYVRGIPNLALPHRSPATSQKEVLENRALTSRVNNPNDTATYGPDALQELQSELDQVTTAAP